MEYSLTIGTFDNRAIDISKDEFESTRKARSTLTDMAMAESKYDLVVENYVELEQTVLGATVEHMIFMPWDFESRGLGHLQLIDRRMFNFLSSATAFLTVSGQCARRIAQAENQFRKQVEILKTSELAFRLMEELRNIANHSGQAIHQINFASSRRDRPDGNLGLEFNLEFSVVVGDLKKNRRDLKYISDDDINQLGDKVDLKPVLRVYMETLSHVQDKLRQFCRADVDKAENQMKSLLKRFNDRFPGLEPETGLFLSEVNGNELSRIPIVSFDKTLKYYPEKNRILANLRHRFATSQVAFEN